MIEAQQDFGIERRIAFLCPAQRAMTPTRPLLALVQEDSEFSLANGAKGVTTALSHWAVEGAGRAKGVEDRFDSQPKLTQNPALERGAVDDLEQGPRLEGLGQLLNTIRLVQKHLNPRLQIEGVLLTMYDGRLNLSRQVADEARKYFDDKVYETVINRNVRLSEAPSFGKPIILYDILSAGAENYISLAKEVLSK